MATTNNALAPARARRRDRGRNDADGMERPPVRALPRFVRVGVGVDADDAAAGGRARPAAGAHAAEAPRQGRAERQARQTIWRRQRRTGRGREQASPTAQRETLSGHLRNITYRPAHDRQHPRGRGGGNKRCVDTESCRSFACTAL
ncbi:hypothetical protein CDD83_625 [Cordyceps sp. RAO-2017]|nr:hypothetical protein CDD83_625 [Cordyceps sp. RAO-2017]